jgi:hypothetical protein
MIKLTEEQFDEQFTPVQNHIDDNASFDGCMFETYGEELEYVKQMAEQNRVVTIIEGDDEHKNDSGESVACMYYITGYHLVNRIGFLILDKPYTEEFEVKLEW